MVHLTLSTLLLGGLFFWFLGRLVGTPKAMLHNRPSAASIDALLPQTQCGRCGYSGCEPYAAALATGEETNRCPPGGQYGSAKIAEFCDSEVLWLDNHRGEYHNSSPVAYIREDECIGCARCLLACPVDAIVGARGFMHTVIATQCSGCDLCLPPCPVDCIDMHLPETLNTPLPASAAPMTFLDTHATTQPETQWACINCGKCNEICPQQLDVAALHHHFANGNYVAMDNKGLADCTLCGDCEPVCPSHIPLAQQFSQARQETTSYFASIEENALHKQHFNDRTLRLQQQTAGQPLNDDTRMMLINEARLHAKKHHSTPTNTS